MVGVVRIFDPLRSKTCHNYKPLRLRAASLLALVGGVVVCLVVNPPPGTLRWGRETVYAKVRKPRTETFFNEKKYILNAIFMKTIATNRGLRSFGSMRTRVP